METISWAQITLPGARNRAHAGMAGTGGGAGPENKWPICVRVHNTPIDELEKWDSGVLGRHTTTPGQVRKKDAKLAQNLGQLQPFTAVLPPECMGQP